jgi:tetratricopeptide (TPR) repeat protein
MSQLGIEPGPELRELQRAILAGEQPGPRPTARVSPSASHPVPRQLPATAGHFAGRAAELKELDVILGQLGTVTISSIGGTGGIGKTTLALHWAHQVADRFPDGQLYVNLRGFGPAAPMSPADALRGFLDALREPGKPVPADQDGQEAMYRSLIAGRRILIILDNARDEQQVRPLLPGSPGCLTLVTSRSQLAGLVATNGAIPLSLGLLTETEARELLTGRLGPQRLAAEPAAVDQLIATCTGLPLALSIAAARAALMPKLALTILSEQLSQPGLDALSNPDPYADLRSVFSWSYRRLSPDAARLFRCLPLFPGPDVSATAAATITPAGLTGKLLNELTGAHLLEEYVPGRFRLHDLLARYAQECSEQEDTDSNRLADAERILTWYSGTAAAAARMRAPDRPIIRDLVQPDPKPARLETGAQAVAWLEAERHNLVAAVEIADQLNVDAAAIALAISLRSLFQLRSEWPDWLRTHLIGIQAARRAGNLDAEAYLHVSSAMPYARLGRAEDALDGLHRALQLSDSRGDLAAEAIARGALSALYFGMGRLAEAIAEGEKAVALAGEADSPTVEFRARIDLGLAYQHTAQLEKALTCYLAARAIETPPLDGSMEVNLASLYLELGRVREAMTEATAALEIAAPIGVPAVEAEAHHVLGDALDSLGRHAEAHSHWRAAMLAYRGFGDARADEMTVRLA